MDRARTLAEAGDPGDVVVWAGEQTAGRGRQGRGWVSPHGNLYATLLLRPLGRPTDAARLGFASGLALADAASAWIAPERVTLKWPNDLMLDGKKAAGILLEASGRAERLDWLMIGSGVNLASHPEGVDYPVASFSGAGAAVTPGELLHSYIKFFDIYRSQLQVQGFTPLRQAWMKRAQGLGQRMTARLPGASLSGIFRDLDEDGALVLEDEPGRRRRITAADVYFG